MTTRIVQPTRVVVNIFYVSVAAIIILQICIDFLFFIIVICVITFISYKQLVCVKNILKKISVDPYVFSLCRVCIFVLFKLY